jgi:hypothetical protein
MLRSKRKSTNATSNINEDEGNKNTKLEEKIIDPFEFPDDDEELDYSTDEEDISSYDSSDEEKEKENKENNYIWSTSCKEFTPKIFNLFSSPSRSIHSYHDALQFLKVFITDDILNMIVEATNKYGNSIYKESWINTTNQEINYFFSSLIYMGIFHYPTLKFYWSKEYPCPFIKNLFNSRDRFLQLYRSFYINPNERDINDILWHVRPLYSHLKKTFPSMYTPSQVLTIDESMVSCKARSNIKQYIKSKHHRWGFKIWCLVNENYLLNFEIYQGRKVEKNPLSPGEAAKKLIAPYYNLNHLIVMDNLFSSIPMCEELLQQSTYVLSTILPNRKLFPKSLVKNSKNLNRYEFTYEQKENIVVYLFYDRKPVYILSSFHHPNLISNIKPHDKDGNEHMLPVPTAVRDYNLYRGEVDNIDQVNSYYPIGRKSKRWWPRLAFWLIDMCIINSWRLYQKQINQKITQLEFRLLLMNQLADINNNNNINNNSNTHTSNINNNIDHWPIHVSEQGRCWYCHHIKKMRSAPQTKCEYCDIYLCIDGCFKNYHTTIH